MKLINLQNENRKVIEKQDIFTVLEHTQDLSVSPANAQREYFMRSMNVRKRQLVVSLDEHRSAAIQAGAMQWTAGSVNATSGVKGAGDLFGKVVKGAVTKESAVKPEYRGSGILVLEPTYKHILLEDAGEWGSGLVVEDGMFLACDGDVKRTVVSRKNVSSAAFGGEGLFNLCLSGRGYAALESSVPRNELIEVILEGDELKIDGNLAVCWSKDLSFTVELSSKSLFGSAVGGEGLVNVYRGHGRILMCPTANTSSLESASSPSAKK